MAEIDVKESSGISGSTFHVTVRESGSQSNHTVRVPEGLYKKLSGGKATKPECVKAAFKFLLDREPKESILREFELSVIARYFPEFEREFKNYLS